MQYYNIDPELQQTIELLKSVLGQSACFDFTDLDAARSISAAMSEASIAATPARSNVKISNTVIQDSELNINVELQIYQNKLHKINQPVILFIHGGGYVMGAAHHAQTGLSRWCDELSVTIVSVEYRLAPEHPFPAGLNDCFAALKWLSKNDDGLNVDTQRLAIVGDSAGGGLATGLSLYARDHSDINIALQLLMWPMLDPANIKAADPLEPIKVLWNQTNNKFAWEAYLNADIDVNMHKYAAPLTSDDLSGLPPTYIGIGDQDLFFAENQCFAEKLKEFDVTVNFKSYPGGFHGFSVANPIAAISQQFNQDVMSALNSSLFI